MVKVKEIVKTCDCSPAQWEGITEDNRRIYVRYRWGCLAISIGEIGDMSEFAAVAGEEILWCQHGDEYHGEMEYSELKTLSAGVVEFPEVESGIITWNER
jgi:hypothetical protein